MSYNPFEELISRLERIESILIAPTVSVIAPTAPQQALEIINSPYAK